MKVELEKPSPRAYAGSRGVRVYAYEGPPKMSVPWEDPDNQLDAKEFWNDLKSDYMDDGKVTLLKVKRKDGNTVASYVPRVHVSADSVVSTHSIPTFGGSVEIRTSKARN